MYGVNVMCLEGIAEEELAELPVAYVGGHNDEPQASPRFFAHL
jgi:hypothetical protein